LVSIQIGHAEHREIAALPHHEPGIENPDPADIAQASQLLDDPTFE
jgi:hypothetical protein